MSSLARALAIFWFVAVGAYAQDKDAPKREVPEPKNVIAGLVTESAQLQKALKKYLTYTYTAGEKVLVSRAYQERGVWYQPFLKDLVEMPGKGAQPSIMKWPDRLAGHTTRLAQLFVDGASRTALRDQFYLTHQAYWKSLAAFYSLSEELVTWYLGPRASQPINKEYRDRAYAADLVRWLDAGHKSCQGLMGLMSIVRSQEGYENLSPHYYFKGDFQFETLYGKFYFAGVENMDWTGKTARDSGPYFYPYLYPHLLPNDLSPIPDGGSAATASAADQREYALLQELFERNPALRDNEALRKRLGELQDRIDGARREGGTSGSGEEPASVRNSADLRRLILQMQTLTGSDDLKDHPQVRAAIQRFLQQVRPGLPPLKPLPPPPPAEETPLPRPPASPSTPTPSTPSTDRLTSGKAKR